jgi:hypothetical protein
MVGLAAGVMAVALARRHDVRLPDRFAVTDELTPTTDTARLSPDLYGTTSAARPWGRLVDTPDSLSPIVVLIHPGATPIDGWAGLQALLERYGLASAATADPTAGFWVDVERLAGEGRRPIRAILIGTALDRLDDEQARRLAGQPIVVLAPSLGEDQRPWWRRLLGDTGAPDTRLARLGDQVLLVTMRDDPGTPDEAVARLAAGGRNVQRAVLDGGGVVPPPLHPELPMWESVVRALRGESGPSTIELDPSDADTTPGGDPTGAS